MKLLNISVVIPVYNAEKFLEKSVISAHQFDCVDEIILVEDGSRDKSLEVCKKIINKYPKTKLFTHKNNKNKGAGATRNLGILKAKNKWISFLDADDVFLPNRFDKELDLIKSNIGFDGVYGALGVLYYSKESEIEFKRIFRENHKLTTVSEFIKPKELKYVLLGIHSNLSGYFSLDALTVRKELILEVGLFNEKLRLHQDTDMIIKLSCIGNLVSGEINKPIALRGVHDENRITNNKKVHQTRSLLYKELYLWARENKLENKIQYHIFNNLKYFDYLVKEKTNNIICITFHTIKHPSVFFNDGAFSLFIGLSNIPGKMKSLIVIIKNKIVRLFFNKYFKKYRTTFKND